MEFIMVRMSIAINLYSVQKNIDKLMANWLVGQKLAGIMTVLNSLSPLYAFVLDIETK